ncbi:MAG: hypothetical protein CM1200mP30_19850 [Pseudomonadota bacterium]|nr:MAG: hypothetical protein CM1200mP30_19850 [Pseudomonadota bacterium]
MPVVYDGVGQIRLKVFEVSCTFWILASFGAASGPPPELTISVLAKSLYCNRPGLGRIHNPELTEENFCSLFDAKRNGLSISINQTYALKDAERPSRFAKP